METDAIPVEVGLKRTTDVKVGVRVGVQLAVSEAAGVIETVGEVVKLEV